MSIRKAVLIVPCALFIGLSLYPYLFAKNPKAIAVFDPHEKITAIDLRSDKLLKMKEQFYSVKDVDTVRDTFIFSFYTTIGNLITFSLLCASHFELMHRKEKCPKVWRIYETCPCTSTGISSRLTMLALS